MRPSTKMRQPPCTPFCTTDTDRRRKRTATAALFNVNFLKILCLHVLLFETSLFVNSAAWTNGPEDRFFCGFKWDDEDCEKRQHCASGQSEECEGFEDGVKCFANSNCDTRYGHGDWHVPGEPPKQSPGGTSNPTYDGPSDNATDHYWCGIGLDDAKRCANNCPSGSSLDCPQGNICYLAVYQCDARNLIPPTASPVTDTPTIGPTIQGPTKIPTEMPIGPPDPLPPSPVLTDHWFCGVGIDDANAKCKTHCPTASECPMNEICYFGTQCDRRTHAPTPPPTKRPTPFPTLPPSVSPTFTMSPTPNPTSSFPPTDAPSEQRPTKSPTPSPTKRPTYAPMPSLQSSFFCGSDWNDAIRNCKRRCPTGESTECPFDEYCFSMTPCTEEMGYPEDYGLGEGGGKSGGAAGGGSEGNEACVPFKVTIIADHWPKETSWMVENTEFEDTEHSVIAEGTDLIPGEPVEWVECVNNRNGCYEFTISDTGGDGICCEHGSGSYKISYDGVLLKEGGAFYDDEKTPFGICGTPETDQPTKRPTEASGYNSLGGGAVSGGGGDSAHRCVANPLVESGYVVSRDKCDLFVDCFNQQINVGDDWFCDENSQCVEAPACGIKEDPPFEGKTSPVGGDSYRCVATQLAQSGYVVSSERCELFDSCDGDDTNCDETASCVETPNCADKISVSVPPPAPLPVSSSPTVGQPVSSSPTVGHPVSNPPTVAHPTSNPPTSHPTPKALVSRPVVARPKPAPDTTPKMESEPPTPAPEAADSTTEVSTPKTPDEASPMTESKPPTPAPEAADSTTEVPTLIPTTIRPTFGPCGGAQCLQEDHCRSQYGYCGSGKTYCNEEAIWTKACVPDESESPTNQPVTMSPTALIPVFVADSFMLETESPTRLPTTMRPTTTKPAAFKKPGGGKKPSGGKGGLSKPSQPASANLPTTYYPTREPTNKPTESKVATNDPTVSPSSSPSVTHSNMITTYLDSPTTALPTSRPTQPPSPRPTQPPSNRPTEAPLKPKPRPEPNVTKPKPSPSKSKEEEKNIDISSETQAEGDEAETKYTYEANTVQLTASDTSADTSTVATHEPGCEGEPCPVDTHCRSRYGSCGPGFIYCNLYSIWQNSCPPIAPGTRPTRTPTSKPTKSPKFTIVEYSIPSTPSVGVVPKKSSKPTFSRLTTPTLPTITDARPFVPPSSLLATDEGFAESEEADTNDGDSNSDERSSSNSEEDSDSDERSSSIEDEPESSTFFQSSGYLDDWATGKVIRNGASLKGGLNIFSAATAFIVLYFIDA